MPTYYPPTALPTYLVTTHIPYLLAYDNNSRDGNGDNFSIVSIEPLAEYKIPLGFSKTESSALASIPFLQSLALFFPVRKTKIQCYSLGFGGKAQG